MDIVRECVPCFEIQALSGREGTIEPPLAREVGDNARITLGEFQFTRSRETNHFDLELTIRN
jgi:hypothetical protein